MKSACKIAILTALLLSGGGAFGFVLRARNSSATQGSDQDSRARIDEILRSPVFSTGQVGVLALTMDGDTLAANGHLRKMVPASNAKLLTTGAALLEFGPDYRFETTLAYSGTVRDGVLEGDLYIVGGGDPTLGASCECARPIQSVFQEWTRLISDAGIRRIGGRVVGDPRFFSGIPECMDWSYDDLGRYYGAGPAGLNFYENSQLIEVYPASEAGAAPSVILKYPYTPWMCLVNSAVTTAKGGGRDLWVTNTDFGPFVRLNGHLTVGGMANVRASNRYPAYTCAYYFKTWLEEKGILSAGCADVSPEGFVRTDLLFSSCGSPAADPSSLTVLGSTESANLAMIVSKTNRESDNFYAETLMHMIGVSRRGSSDYGSSRPALTDALASLGLKTSGRCRVYDGSGLSRQNYVSPDFMVEYLRRMMRTKVGDRFLHSLPQPGEGTLSERLRGKSEDIRSRVYMKSGSMDGVRCYSGYILSPDGDSGHDIAFSILTGNITAPASSLLPLIDEIIAILAAGK